MDPIGAAAAGVISICLVVVLPLSIGVHFLARRYLPVSILAVPVAFTLVMLAIMWTTDDPTNMPLHRASFAAWWSFWPALVVSLLAAVPVIVYKVYRRWRPAT
ncbi:MAG TPA: hypothetical protein VHS31_07190 [Tepidisphaeraceae bacterium]|jgi:hypothetical protein|nr:hypothetical protein [Tepidisphaeraceae bacterium]